jgi:hypothetical protein
MELDHKPSRDFAKEHGAMKRMSWEEACPDVKDAYDIDLDYTAGRFLPSVSETDMKYCMTAAVQVVKQVTVLPPPNTADRDLADALEVLAGDERMLNASLTGSEEDV